MIKYYIPCYDKCELISLNFYQRVFAIGDIHGMFSLLKSLIQKLEVEADLCEADSLVFIGDYIDRGTNSKEVIDYCLELKEKYHCVFLKGNHEDMFIDLLNNGGIYCGDSIYNGGIDTLASYGIHYYLNYEAEIDFLPTTHQSFFSDLVSCAKWGNYFFVHAGLDPKREIEDQEYSFKSRSDLMFDENTCLWIRDEFIHSTEDFGFTVIYGHTPSLCVTFDLPYKIGIDTKAFESGKLSAIELPSYQIFST